MIASLIEKINTAGIPIVETLHILAPKENHATYHEKVDAESGDDGGVLIKNYNVTLDYYEYQGEASKKEDLEEILNSYITDFENSKWTKDERVFYQQEKVFCTTYRFSYKSKTYLELK